MSPSVPPTFDERSLDARVGDPELVTELLHDFLGRADGDIAALRRAVIADDVRGVRVRAHALRGLLATISADKASRVAGDIEELLEVAPSDIEGLTGLVERLAGAVGRACEAMRLALRQRHDERQGSDAILAARS